MKVQFNFELPEKDAAPILAEAERRGMKDSKGSPNRAMIARTLVEERISQLHASAKADEALAIKAEADAYGIDLRSLIKREMRAKAKRGPFPQHD